MAKLSAPTNVAIALVKATGTTPATLTVTFTDPNPQAAVSGYDLQFLLRADPTVSVTPSFTPGNITKVPSGANTNVTIPGISVPAASAPLTVDQLQSDYVARVVVKATATADDSDPGLSTFWTGNLSVVIQLGSHTLTLTEAKSNTGIFELDASVANPVVITLADIDTFLNGVKAGLQTAGITVPVPDLPTTFPNNSPIAGVQLQIQRLAVDTRRHLFSLQVTAVLNFTLVPGLSVNSVGLVLMCTNGVDDF